MSAIVKVDKRPHRKIAQEHWGLTDEQMKGMHVHHRILKSEGGTNDPSNLYVCSPWFHANIWHGVPELLSLIKNSTENARKGGASRKGETRTEEQKTKISKSLTGRKASPEVRAHLSKIHTGRKLSTGHSKAISEGRKLTPKVICPHCGKEGQPPPMARWHFDNCKHKVHSDPQVITINL